MTKSKFIQIVIVSIICAWVFDVFFGRLLIAKISTLPVLNRWHILAPQAPIFINNQEVVRSNNSDDLLAAADLAKSKIATIVQISDSQVSVLASAINLTSDGLFATGGGILSANGNFTALLNNGQSAPITLINQDPATGVVFFKAALGNVPVAPLGNSNALVPGEHILFLRNSVQNFTDKFTESYVVSAQADVADQIYSSDHYSQTFTAQATGSLLSGEAVVNSKAEIVGLWNGKTIIPSSLLRQALDSYLTNGGNFSRPAFGFSYQIVSQAESALLNLPEGARVTDAGIAGSPARLGGLLVGDIVTSVNNNQINQSHSLEEQLARFRSGDKVKFSVTRNKQALVLTLTAGEAK